MRQDNPTTTPEPPAQETWINPSVGAVIIGDEILSGKVTDTNSPFLIDRLHRHGAKLQRLTIVSDDPEDLGREVRACSDTFDIGITSGGIGPTHDDRTMRGIADAFDVPLLRHPRLIDLLRTYGRLGVPINDATLKMAETPKGAFLVETDHFPVVRFRNIFILPGVPEIFRRELAVISRAFRGTPAIVERVVLGCYESDVAEELARVHKSHDLVSVGSYPRNEEGREVVLVTLESQSGAAASAALQDLIRALPEGVVLRVETEAIPT